MRNYKRIVYQLISICMGGLLCSCASVSNVDEEKIQQKMKNYLENETGQAFVLESFETTIAYRQGGTKGYRGTFHHAEDKRLVVLLHVNELDNYTHLRNPESALDDYRLLSRTIALSDQTTAIAKNYFIPEKVHTHAWASANNFRIKIYIQDKVTPQNMAKYAANMKKITAEINEKIQAIEDNYFEVVLHVFENGFQLPKYEAHNGANDFNGPTGDYNILTDMDENGEVSLNSRMGFGSKLERSIKNQLFAQYNIERDSHLHKDFHPHKDWYQEDMDKNGVRHYARIMLPIQDEKTGDIIERVYLKVNVFTREMTPYQPTHP